ncbi:MAG TPA: FHA domain-containing protein [Spirochaetota bacterium]|nr:FHA domain-containing protein [Spirochaetota bacterium]
MSKDMFSQETGKFVTNDQVKIIKSAKINAKGSIPRLEVAGQSKCLSNKAFGIGRDKSNQLVVADAKVSRYHALVTFENCSAYIKDTNSSNGTFINDKIIPTGVKTKLNNGDKIKVGNTVIVFHE